MLNIDWSILPAGRFHFHKAGEGGCQWVTIRGRAVCIGGTGGADRAERARRSYVPTNRREQGIADKSEAELARKLGLRRTGDNSAFDLEGDRSAVEVKTLIDQRNNKITMHQDAVDRKLAYADDNGLKAYTVVIDKRGGGGGLYYREGVGSFRLANMKSIGIGALRGLLGSTR